MGIIINNKMKVTTLLIAAIAMVTVSQGNPIADGAEWLMGYAKENTPIHKKLKSVQKATI